MIKQFLAAALIVSAATGATAQQMSDSTQQSQPSQDQQQPSNQFNSRDYSPMQSSEVPSSLRTTLRGDTYKGWESGKIYRRKNGDGYWLSTGSGSNVQNYYFDKNGKAVQGRNGGNSNDGSDRSNSGSGRSDDSGSGASGSGSGSSGSGSEKPKQ